MCVGQSPLVKLNVALAKRAGWLRQWLHPWWPTCSWLFWQTAVWHSGWYHRETKNLLDPCRERQGSFFLLLLCTHLALHEHIVIELGLDNETIRPTVFVSTAKERTDQKDVESRMCWIHILSSDRNWLLLLANLLAQSSRWNLNVERNRFRDVWGKC